MPFQWQERDEAAQTLGVDTQRLQDWIDTGQAPSRQQNGRVEVLIEFPDDSEDEPSGDAPAEEPVAEAQTLDDDEFHAERAAPHEHADSAGAHAATEPRAATFHQLELISRRELQMAAGTVAAWQRLAETAEHELHRSRRFGALAWSLIAALLLIGGAGLWWATYQIIETRAAADFARTRLAEAAEDSDAARDRLHGLERRAEQLADDLHETREQLAAARERAALAEARNEQLLEQQRTAADLAETRAESHRSHIAALESAAEDQRRRIAEFEAGLADARDQLETAREELDTTRRRLADAD